jgi:hypothetical protein
MCKINVKMVFIMLTYAKWQGYGVRSCVRLMLNRIKEMKGLISIYTPLKT